METTFPSQLFFVPARSGAFGASGANAFVPMPYMLGFFLSILYTIGKMFACA